MEETKMNNLNKFLFVVLITLIILIPKIISSVNGVSDVHMYSSIVPAQVSINKDKIISQPFERNEANTLNGHTNSQAERIGMTSVQVVLYNISGLELKALQFIPFNSLILIILAYVISMQFLRSRFYGLSVAVFLAYEPNIGLLTNTTSEHAFGYVLYFASIIIFIKMYEYKEFKHVLIPMFVVLFITTTMVYYTTEFYLIILSLSFYGILFVSSKMKTIRIELPYRYDFKLPLILIIIFLMFDNVTSSYIGRGGLLDGLHKNVFKSLYDFFTDAFVKLLGFSTENVPSTYLSGNYNSLVTLSGILLYLALLIPIAIYIVQSIRKFKLKYTMTLHNLLFLSFLFTGIIDVLIYILIGFVSLKYILLVFPMLTFFSIDKLIKSRCIKKSLVILIVSLCIFKYGTYYWSTQFQDNSYQFTDPSTKWLSNNVKSDSRILSDLNLGGKMLIESSYNNLNFTVFGFRHFERDENAMFLYSNNLSDANKIFDFNKYNYLVLNTNNINKPFAGLAWRSFPPIENNIYYLDNYHIFNKIYDDNVFVYKYNSLR